MKKGRRVPYGLIGKILLGTIAGVGAITLAVAVPNAVQALKVFNQFNGQQYRRYRTPAYFREAVKRMERQKLVRPCRRGTQIYLELTEKGRQRLQRYHLKEKNGAKKKWDGRWRMIIFDIEEDWRWKRDALRKDMEEFGLVRLQDSVWVYPYDCEEIISLLKAQYAMGDEILYIVAGEIENDVFLKQKFNLD